VVDRSGQRTHTSGVWVPLAMMMVARVGMARTCARGRVDGSEQTQSPLCSRGGDSDDGHGERWCSSRDDETRVWTSMGAVVDEDMVVIGFIKAPAGVERGRSSELPRPTRRPPSENVSRETAPDDMALPSNFFMFSWTIRRAAGGMVGR
jgi:hypothetical protein